MKTIRNMKIVQKLLLLVIISSLSLVGVGVTGYKYMLEMAKGSEIMYSKYLLSINKLGQMQKNNFAIDSYTMSAMLTKSSEEYYQLIQNIDDKVQENLSLESAELFPKEVIDMDSYYELIDGYISGRTTALKMAENKKDGAYEYYLNNVQDKRLELDNVVNDIQAYFSNLADEINKKNKEQLRTATIILVGVTLICLLLSVLIGQLISKAIVNPIKSLQNLMAKAASGQLTLGNYQAKDELGQLSLSYNGMIDGIKDIVQATQETSEMVVSSSEQLSASAQQSTQASEHISSMIQEIAAGSNSQLHSVEETANIINNMAKNTEQIVDSTNEMKISVNNSANMSIEGKQSIDRVTLQMNNINENVSGLGNSIEKLSDHLHEIGAINEAITAIADQTNLLSLNAAIEAARAGEHGKGFAVVADEVRKLAEQSANSANQITRLIDLIQIETTKTLESMNSASHEVEAGISVVQDAGEVFGSIEESIHTVVNQINNITYLINELTAGAQQVAQSMDIVKRVAEDAASKTENVSAATEEQLASMEEVSSSAINLAKISEELQKAIKNLKM